MKRGRKKAIATTLASTIAAGAAACGDIGSPGGAGGEADAEGSGGDALEGLEEIAIEPAAATVVTEDGEPGTESFSAIGTFEGGAEREISEHASFSVEDSRLGSFSGSRFESGTRQGGVTEVVASAAGHEARADLTVRLVAERTDPRADVPDEPGDDFDDADEDPALAPEIVYPVSEVLVPPNIEALEVHLLPSGGAELFEISFTSETTEVSIYTDCVEPVGGGCVYTPEQELWRQIASSNRGGAVEVGARAADAGAVGAAESKPLGFAADDIRGAIYYWTTSEIIEDDEPTGIMRYDFASGPDEPEVFLDPSDTDGNCVGCHSLSPDGSKMFTSAGGDGGQVLLTRVATGESIVDFDSTPRSAYGAWNPDGDRFAGTYSLEDQDEEQDGWLSYDLNIFHGEDGAHLETIDLGGTPDQPISQPDWSPQGDQIAFIHMGAVGGSQVGGSGTHAFAVQASIGVIEREGDGWSDPDFLTDPPEGENTYFPAFNPEGDLLAFNRSSCPDGENGSECYAHGDPNAALFVTRPAPDAEEVELARANEPGPMDETDVVMNSFPKWPPFTFEGTDEFGGGQQWLSFASDRQYGLREPGDDIGTLIWMSAIDPERARDGEDPSYPAFALPFQDPTTDNRSAQWTQTTVIIE